MLLRKIVVALATVCFNAFYQFCCKHSNRGKTVLFTSQQQGDPNYDYVSLAREFTDRGWTAVIHVGLVRRGSPLRYLSFIQREIKLLSQSRIVFVDRYDPVISLIDFEYEDAVPILGYWNDFPSTPIIVQLWHAFGAYKKFGFQSSDVMEGHSTEESSLFKIHRNYSWVVCSGEGARRAFSEALAYPMDRVVPLSRPTQRKLVLERRRLKVTEAKDRPVVLFAPTVRKYDHEIHPLRDLEKRSTELFESAPFEVRWSFHPLEMGGSAVDGSVRLLDVDYVVTDYSSIVYEAYLLGKRVAFFIPDIEHYRVSPGLNADPTILCPDLVVNNETELCSLLSMWVQGESIYPAHELETFVDGSFEGSGDDPSKDIVEFVINKLSQ